jgi:hypothetical protein
VKPLPDNTGASIPTAGSGFAAESNAGSTSPVTVTSLNSCNDPTAAESLLLDEEIATTAAIAMTAAMTPPTIHALRLPEVEFFFDVFILAPFGVVLEGW